MTGQVRVLRVLEYVGTREFVERSLEKRSIHGEMRAPNGYIREAFLGGILGFESVEEEDET